MYKRQDDDLNTADGIAAVFDLVRDINTFIAVPRAKEALSYASEMFDRLVTDVLGLLYDRKEDNLDAEIEALIEQRQQARKEKNFALADKIRDDLKASLRKRSVFNQALCSGEGPAGTGCPGN